MAVPFVALSWRPGSEPAARHLAQALECANGWTRAHRTPGLEVWTAGRRALPVTVRTDLSAVIVGRLFGATGRTKTSPARTPQQAAKHLIDAHWGEYIAILGAGGVGARWVLRDPSGALDALTWTRDGVGVVASNVDQLPPELLPRQMGLDWDRIADAVRRPMSATAQSPLDGLHTVTPGDLHPVGGGRDAIAIWRPSTFMAKPHPAAPESEADLRARIDMAVGSLVEAYPRLLIEVSGGLDSAIVATTLLSLGLGARVVAPLHLVDGHAEGNEVAWADPVLRKFRTAPVLQSLAVEAFDERALNPFSRGARPALNALDPNRLTGTRAAAAASGADAVLTGKGGDAVFFQHPTAAVLADYLQAHGRAHLWGQTAQMVARWLRRSVWSVSREAHQILRHGPTIASPSALWGEHAREPSTGLAHPWLSDIETLPPAKQWQLKALLTTQLQRGYNGLTDAVDVLHPLMSQPVLEGILPIATWDLVRGARERGLARAVFADRVPASIRGRRSKGQLNAHFAKTVAESLAFLRPHLLEGCLAEARILDRQALEAALHADALIWAADPAMIMAAAAIESWVRHWQTRVPDSAMAPRRRSLE